MQDATNASGTQSRIKSLDSYGKPEWLCAGAGGIYDRQHTETAVRQLAYYKKVYAEVSNSVFGSRAIKGILFWRWKAADPTIVLGTDDQAATLGAFGSPSELPIKQDVHRAEGYSKQGKRPGCNTG